MYFDSMGKANTDAVAECVARYLKEHPVRYAVVATVTGYTAEIMLQALPGVALAAVTHVIGMRKNGEDEMEEGVREGLRQKGVRLVTAAHVLSGAERGISGAFGGTYPVEVMAQTLRMFGAGLKVAVECATMALDNGAGTVWGRRDCHRRDRSGGGYRCCYAPRACGEDF